MARGPRTLQRFGEQVAHAAGARAGHEDEHLVAGGGEGGHAMMEEIHGRFQVFGREIQTLGRPGGARTLKGGDSGDLALGDAQKIRAAFPYILLRGQGQPGQIGRALDGLRVDPGQSLPVERTFGGGQGQGFAQARELATGQIFRGERGADPGGDPVVEGRFAHQSGSLKRPRYRVVPSMAVAL